MLRLQRLYLLSYLIFSGSPHTRVFLIRIKTSACNLQILTHQLKLSKCTLLDVRERQTRQDIICKQLVTQQTNSPVASHEINSQMIVFFQNQRAVLSQVSRWFHAKRRIEERLETGRSIRWEFSSISLALLLFGVISEGIMVLLKD